MEKDAHWVEELLLLAAESQDFGPWSDSLSAMVKLAEHPLKQLAQAFSDELEEEELSLAAAGFSTSPDFLSPFAAEKPQKRRRGAESRPEKSI